MWSSDMFGLTGIQLKLAEWGVAAAMVAMLCVGVWFRADAYYSAKFEAFKASVAQQAKDQKLANDATTKRINDEAEAKAANMRRVLGDLADRLQHAGSSPIGTCKVPAQSVSSPVGPGTEGRVEAPADPEGGPVSAVTIDPQLLADVLDADILHVQRELEYRDFERSIGAMK
jgi:hypothetical protein